MKCQGSRVLIVSKFLLKILLLVAFIISPFFAPHASAARTSDSHHKATKPHHKTTKSSHKATKPHHKTAKSSHKAIKPHHKTAKSSHKAIKRHHKTVKSHHKTAKSRHKATRSHHNMAKSSRKTSNSFGKIAKSSRRVSEVGISRFYSNWKGVRYRLGGTTKKGIDCSALTQRAFKKMNIRIPRTTGGQLARGKRIPKAKLQFGDLVFFRTSRHQRHVGIYIGNGKFMHASTTKGVTISRLANQYWAAHYETSTRISS
ncbi:NlpC/P60 family protein [Enterobacteriaceae bacterium H16N7]|nr:NlpC/P60 family protein [Dryocola clanedunensis]